MLDNTYKLCLSIGISIYWAVGMSTICCMEMFYECNMCYQFPKPVSDSGCYGQHTGVGIFHVNSILYAGAVGWNLELTEKFPIPELAYGSIYILIQELTISV